MTDKIILYAEDDKELRECVVENLQARGISNPVEEFSDGVALEERLKQGVDGVGVVLTDNQMPGIRGSKIIEKYAPRIGLPFILFCAGAESTGQYLSNKYNNVSYVGKPDIGGLMKVMHDILD